MGDLDTTIADRFLRGTRLLRAGQCEDALLEFRAVYALAEESGHPELMATCLCEMSWACFRLGRPEQGLECAMGAKWLWERIGNQAELARGLAVEAILLLDFGFSDEAFETATRALTIAETAEDAAVLAFALNIKGVVLVLCREEVLGIELIERSVAMASTSGNVAAEAYYVLNLGFASAKQAEAADALGERDRASIERNAAIAFSARAVEKAELSGDFWTMRVALCNSAEFLALEGQFDAALACLDRCLLLPGDPGPSLTIVRQYVQGDVLMRLGRASEAEDMVRQALTLADAASQLDHQVNAACKLAEILEVNGKVHEALAMHKRFHALYVRQTGENAGRLARIEEIRVETERLRSHAAFLADQAMADPLTGIANRRSFDQNLERLAGTPFSVAIVDLDHFKTINDRHSHIVGDVVLQRVARLMADAIGESGHVARLGGEEFALVLPNASAVAAFAACEGLRTAVAARDFSDLGERLGVTISIGLSVGTGYEPAGELMQLADTRLYQAKANGRDCVVGGDFSTRSQSADYTLEKNRLSA
ncbi:diguanylate cyclase [Devosia sp. 2618]|uniref:diguanylate cyclase n=1 Tax=Devosia sp. 2618 TaxID=3156454 RepID=UPI0033990F9B